MSDNLVQEIISQIPSWESVREIKIDPLEGLTNTNYKVTVDGEGFVLRIAGENSARLGIDRQLEYEALLAAANAGIGPQVLHCILPQGHLVTRYINGRHWTLAEYRQRVNLRRIVETVQRLHALPPVRATFSPFRRVEAFVEQVQTLGVSLPADFDTFLQRMSLIESQQAEDDYPWQRFCHNDLFSVNVLDDGELHFIDWEFSGVGDIYFDLATLSYAYDSVDTLSPELQQYLLACYFGTVSEKNYIRLEGMKYMLMFFSAMWGMLQYGMQRSGLVRFVEGFDFMEYAEVTFQAMRSMF